VDYTQKKIKRIIERYQELVSISEVVSSCLEDGHTKEFSKCRGFEHIVCMLVDVDNSMSMLTPRQKEVVTMIKQGCSTDEISSRLNISPSTIKIHTEAAALRISNYLNQKNEMTMSNIVESVSML